MPSVGMMQNGRLSHAFVLLGFLGFQTLDAITTHVGLMLQHTETNRLMAPVISVHGELMAYALKGTGIAALLVLLMLLQSTRPRVWQAFHLAAWLTSVGVIVNVSRLVG